MAKLSAHEIVEMYRSRVLKKIDSWQFDLVFEHRDKIKCTQGCTDCCHQIFEIGPLDILQVKDAFDSLKFVEKMAVQEKLAEIQKDLAVMGIKTQSLSQMPVEQRKQLAGYLNGKPCIFLDDSQCLIYPFRPYRCRVVGAPLVSCFGGTERVVDWCAKNFENISLEDAKTLTAPVQEFEEEKQKILAEAGIEMESPGEYNSVILLAVLFKHSF